MKTIYLCVPFFRIQNSEEELLDSSGDGDEKQSSSQSEGSVFEDEGLLLDDEASSIKFKENRTLGKITQCV